jgi:hypothetical protein
VVVKYQRLLHLVCIECAWEFLDGLSMFGRVIFQKLVYICFLESKFLIIKLTKVTNNVDIKIFKYKIYVRMIKWIKNKI